MEFDPKQIKILMHKVAFNLGNKLEGLLYQPQNILCCKFLKGKHLPYCSVPFLKPIGTKVAHLGYYQKAKTL